jgi:hypothetical protein
MDAVAFIGLKEENNALKFYTCMRKNTDFQSAIETKLRNTSSHHGTEIALVKNVRRYLREKVPLIAADLQLRVVTDLEHDRLLTIKVDNLSKHIFVYFGALNKDWIHVACWLRLDVDNDKITKQKPKLFFWMMEQSYAQPAEALASVAGRAVNRLDTLLDLTDGIEYS